MEVLVTRYFMLRQSDLEVWEEDPEAWAVMWDDQTDSWEFLLRVSHSHVMLQQSNLLLRLTKSPVQRNCLWI